MASVIRTFHPNKKAVQTGSGPDTKDWARLAKSYIPLLEKIAEDSDHPKQKKAKMAVDWLVANAWTVDAVEGAAGKKLVFHVDRASKVRKKPRKGYNYSADLEEDEQSETEWEDANAGDSFCMYVGFKGRKVSRIMSSREVKKYLKSGG